MTRKNKLELRQSEVRSRLNDLAGAEMNDEVSREINELTKEYGDNETQLRAAIIAEGGTEVRETESGTQFARLVDDVEVRSYFETGLSGAALELNQELGLPNEGPSGGVLMPFAMLLPPEERADAVSGVTVHDGSTIADPVLARLFDNPVTGALGVRMDSVDAGNREYVLLTGGVAPVPKAENTNVDATAATVSTVTLKPKKVTAGYVITGESIAAIGSSWESALRSDLQMALQDAVNNQVVNGNGTAPNFTGVFQATTAATAATAVSALASYASVPSSMVDGQYCSAESDVSVILHPHAYTHAGSLFVTNTAISALQALRNTGASVMASNKMKAGASNVYTGIAHRSGGTGRTDSVLAMWNTGIEFVRDIYTQASKGNVAIRGSVYGDFNVIRTDAYKQLSHKTA